MDIIFTESAGKQELTKPNVSNLANEIINKANSTDRFIVAIAGPPASGKSTIAEELSSIINQQSKLNISDVVPMDGFHLNNDTLDKLELRHRKGAENTFDSEGFATMIRALHANTESVKIPVFDRNIDASIPDARIISSELKILIVEGNYLLLNSKPWSELHTLYDFTVLLNPSIETIKERLFKRWRDNGYDDEGAKHRALSNDIPNAEFVLDHSVSADLVIV